MKKDSTYLQKMDEQEIYTMRNLETKKFSLFCVFVMVIFHYIFNQPLWYRQDVTQGQVLSGVKLV